MPVYLDVANHCMELFANEFEHVRPSDATMDKLTRGAHTTFKRLLTDESGDDRRAERVWPLCERRLTTRVRALAAISEGYALDEVTEEVTLDHVKRALKVLQTNCTVTVGDQRTGPEKLDFCWVMLVVALA